MSDDRPMTAQEQELLQYLEDLQANNPAEYELLVKDLNEKAAAEGKGPSTQQQQGEQVTPLPGFVAKTRSATNKGRKVFINVCQSDHVDKPAPVEGDDDSEEVQMRIPLSLGPPREDLDKTGEVCTVYDVVFNPEAVEMALKDEEMRTFMMHLTVYQIEQKCKDEVSSEMTFPKVKGNYKGIAPMPQIMRKKGVAPPPVPGSAAEKKLSEEKAVAEAKAKEEAEGKKMVQEMAEPGSETLPAPCYSVEPRYVGKVRVAGTFSGSGEGGSGSEPTGRADEGGASASADGAEAVTNKADAISIKMHLPDVADEENIQLDLSAEQLELLVPGNCALSLQLPQAVCLPPLSAKFETERKILSLLLRMDAVGSMDGGLGGDARAEDASATAAAAAGSGDVLSEGMRREREREARLNARRKREAGNKQLARQAKAAAAAEVGDGGSNAGAAACSGGAATPTGAGPDAAARAAEEAATEGQAVAATAQKKAKEVEKSKEKESQLELTNSIMYELEELFGV